MRMHLPVPYARRPHIAPESLRLCEGASREGAPERADAPGAFSVVAERLRAAVNALE